MYVCVEQASVGLLLSSAPTPAAQVKRFLSPLKWAHPVLEASVSVEDAPASIVCLRGSGQKQEWAVGRGKVTDEDVFKALAGPNVPIVRTRFGAHTRNILTLTHILSHTKHTTHNTQLTTQTQHAFA